jgi:hypothetical protein
MGSTAKMPTGRIPRTQMMPDENETAAKLGPLAAILEVTHGSLRADLLAENLPSGATLLAAVEDSPGEHRFLIDVCGEPHILDGSEGVWIARPVSENEAAAIQEAGVWPGDL